MLDILLTTFQGLSRGKSATFCHWQCEFTAPNDTKLLLYPEFFRQVLLSLALAQQPIAVPTVRSRSLKKRHPHILDEYNKQLLKLLRETEKTLIITTEKLLEKELIFEEDFMAKVNNNRSR